MSSESDSDDSSTERTKKRAPAPPHQKKKEKEKEKPPPKKLVRDICIVVVSGVHAIELHFFILPRFYAVMQYSNRCLGQSERVVYADQIIYYVTWKI